MGHRDFHTLLLIKGFVANADGTYSKTRPGNPSPRPQPQPVVRDEPLGPVPRTDGDGPRYAVRIISFRVRSVDPDNLCGKHFIDALRHAGIIPDDTTAIMDYSISQQKVKSKEEESTQITVERL